MLYNDIEPRFPPAVKETGGHWAASRITRGEGGWA
jgi:hypothetical protein